MSPLVVGRFPAWEPAVRCTSGPTPGALALMSWFVEQFGDAGGFNLGIYNCRSVRGASTTSLHGEGRADDFGFPVGDKDGDRLLRVLLAHVGALGIQAIIYERVIYSAKSPTGRPYTGLVPHLDHLHVELTREAGRRLTLATIRRVLEPAPPPKPGDRPLHLGDRGPDVRWLQRRLNRLAAEAGSNVRIPVDGIYGPATKRRVMRFERARQPKHPHLVVDGVVGSLTWRLLGVKSA